MTIASELHKLVKWMSDPEFRDFKRQVKAFRHAHGRGTPDRFDDLSPNDVVLDIGGFQGEWTQSVTQTYGVTAHVFEPHPKFADDLQQRFAERNDVIVHDYALGSTERDLILSDAANASSALTEGADTVRGLVRAVADVFDAFDLGRIAVAKMNIEGGEYDLLPALIKTGLISKIDRLLVQFHKYDETHVQARQAILEELQKTHECAWAYPFVWEEWAIRTRP